MSDLSSRLESINDRISAASVQRSRRALGLASITIIIAGTLAYVWTAYMVLPAFERVRLANQEQIAWQK